MFGEGFDQRVALARRALPAGADVLPYAGPPLSAITVQHGAGVAAGGPVSVATLEQDAASLP
jgi:hypothetical protein